MELPIKIIMILFVSLIVAWSMIQFSKSIIDDSKVKLSDVSKKHDLKGAEDLILDLGPADTTQLFYLAEECKKQGDQNLPTRELCFVARFDSGTVNFGTLQTLWTGAGYPANQLNVDATANGKSTLFIYWDPFDNPARVEIEG